MPPARSERALRALRRRGAVRRPGGGAGGARDAQPHEELAGLGRADPNLDHGALLARLPRLLRVLLLRTLRVPRLLGRAREQRLDQEHHRQAAEHVAGGVEGEVRQKARAESGQRRRGAEGRHEAAERGESHQDAATAGGGAVRSSRPPVLRCPAGIAGVVSIAAELHSPRTFVA